MKIGITGSTGVLGEKLISNLKKHHLSKFKGNITSNHDVEKWIKKSNFDAIIHLAALVPVDLVYKNKIKAKKVNFIGTKFIIDNIKKYYSKKIWFFYASTSHVYKKTNFKLNENSEIKPLNYYALTKHLSEKYLIKNSNYINYCIGRIFSFTSKKQSKKFLIPNLISRIQNNNKEIYLKNLNHFRDFLPIDDVVRAIVVLMKNTKNGIFNICSSKGVLLSEIAKILNHNKKITFEKNKISTTIIGSNKKLKKLNWKPTYKNYIDYLSKNKKNFNF